jgi:hypothetical protein
MLDSGHSARSSMIGIVFDFHGSLTTPWRDSCNSVIVGSGVLAHTPAQANLGKREEVACVWMRVIS